MILKNICLWLFLTGGVAFGQNLTVTFTNIRNTNGVFRVGFFTNQETYDNGDPAFYKTISKIGIQNNALTVTFQDIPEGIYGIVVLDDENQNDKTDFGVFLPIEGFGFSNYTVSLLCVPKFSDFDFVYQKPHTQITIQLKYL